ncbi:helix-turn-helix domain-containing protein [Streptosporangium sp. NBC_01755]|uniref:helix-turn-helix domain-containing protein n=1 Tax=unclassified Streptosporangium TaxID=2632669 RepID=UPI002DD9E99F|nr:MULTISPECIES: helix-turn-helix transcriptional regulator [unclassified Streptosporangium]WSA26300.1 helix-turn-helix domain-containing protein [Streptosporangium sp. NBC_01810]WSD02272.1 helix-turn-helix domain-containing protein [Streptosporangium sp. NBC_01755]
MTSNSPTVKRRKLSQTLRQLRKEAGFSVTEAGRRLEWDASKVSRMERNEWRLPSVHDIRLLLDLYGITDEDQREAMITLARESRQRGWWEKYQDVFRGSLPDFESGASSIRTWQIVLIPGLLQTEGYVRALWRAARVLDETLVERHVQARLTRQEILFRENPPTLLALIDEAALRKSIGGAEVMREQISHLIEMAARPNIIIRIVPDSAGAHPALEGSFVILDFPSDPSLIYTVTATESLWLEQPLEYQRYTIILDYVMGLALSPDESVQHMAKLVEQLKG